MLIAHLRTRSQVTNRPTVPLSNQFSHTELPLRSSRASLGPHCLPVDHPVKLCHDSRGSVNLRRTPTVSESERREIDER